MRDDVSHMYMRDRKKRTQIESSIIFNIKKNEKKLKEKNISDIGSYTYPHCESERKINFFFVINMMESNHLTNDVAFVCMGAFVRATEVLNEIIK